METGFRYDDVPMARDRSEGWRFVRDHGDVFQSESGVWFLTSPEAVQQAHRHPLIFSSARAYDGINSPVPLVPLAIDPPEQKRFRRILDPMLAPRVIDALQDELRQRARALVRNFASRGRCEIVEEFAALYPAEVFLTLFGLPLADRDMLRGWAEAITEGGGGGTGSGPAPSLVQAAGDLSAYLHRAIAEKRAQPSDDMLGRILALEGDDAWSDDEVFGLCFLFVLAGLDTVTASIGFVFQHLARRPDLRRLVCDEPTSIDRVIDEILRLEPPAPTSPRFTTEDVEVGGQKIPAGSSVVLCLGAANRDPTRFPGGDEIDLDPANRGHLSFGGGAHRCLGSHLARRELRLVIEEFHAEIPDYQIEPGFEPEIVWPSETFHLRSLPLEFPAR